MDAWPAVGDLSYATAAVETVYARERRARGQIIPPGVSAWLSRLGRVPTRTGVE